MARPVAFGCCVCLWGIFVAIAVRFSSICCTMQSDIKGVEGVRWTRVKSGE